MADVANISASSGNPGRRSGGHTLDSESGSPDEGLVQRLADGEAGAIAQLYDRYGRLAYSLARRICPDVGRAEEVVREVFVGLWREPQRFDPDRGDLRRWLVTEVHRRSVDALRGVGAQRRRAATESYERDDWSGSETSAGPGRLASEQVREMLARLPGEQRRTFALAFYGGYTLPEIAALTAVPVDTVMSRLFSATRRLRRLALAPRWAAADFVGDGR